MQEEGWIVAFTDGSAKQVGGGGVASRVWCIF